MISHLKMKYSLIGVFLTTGVKPISALSVCELNGKKRSGEYKKKIINEYYKIAFLGNV